MLRVAITGGIGSGKSTVARLLQHLGACVSQSDEVARTLMEPGKPLFNEISTAFGSAVLTPDGHLDRSALARLAFEGGKLQQLTDLVHPAVLAEHARWMAALAGQRPAAVAVVESALVLETQSLPPGSSAAPWRTHFDRIVTVSTAVQAREERYVGRLAKAAAQPADEARADFRRRLAMQWTDAQREALADFVLQNDGTYEQLEAKVARLYDSLTTEARDRAEEVM